MNAPTCISVVIVNYNGRAYLDRCLRSLAAQTYPNFEIILVDNASSDDSVEWVGEHHPGIRVIRSEQNVGFAAGNNLGIRAARGEFIATLNTDTEVEPDYLACLIEGTSEPTVGACAPLMLEFARRDRIDAAGIRIDRAGFAWNRLHGARVEDVRGEREVFGACAGAALYRRAMLDQIGPFDENYFGYYEDADLAWRAQRAGWKTRLVPSARVYHIHGGSFGKAAGLKLFLLARNRWWTLFKNYPMPALLMNFPFIVITDLVALVGAIVVHHSLAPLWGRVAAFRAIFRMWGKRREMCVGAV